MSEKDEVDEETKLWASHPRTRSLAKMQRERTQSALSYLLSACSGSSDPKVREAMAIYTTEDKTLDVLEGRTKP